MFNVARTICGKQIHYAAIKKNLQLANVPLLLRQNTTISKNEQTYTNNKKGSSSSSKGFSITKSILIGTAAGAAFGTFLSLYDSYKQENVDTEYRQSPAQLLDKLPDVRITKRFVNATDNSGLDIVLFQFQTCPFCCKVRAFLDAMGISYAVVEVDAVLRQDIKWSKSKKVPTILLRQKDQTRWVQLTDSSAIVSLLATYLYESGHVDVVELAGYYPNVSFVDDNKKRRDDILNKYFLMFKEHTPQNVTKEEQEKERQWRMWVDNHLVHLISPNCYQTLGEALETFKWFSDAGEWDKFFPSWERDLMVYVGAVAMWAIAKMLKRRHGLTDDVRSHIYAALDKWTDELKKQKSDYYGGKKPNLADLAVFGVLGSMEGCQAFKDCLQNTNIGPWFQRMKSYVQQRRGQLA